MNQKPSQSRLTLIRFHGVASRTGAFILFGSIATSAIDFSLLPFEEARTAKSGPGFQSLSSAIKPLRLPLGDRDRTFDIFTAAAEIGEHVEHDEVGQGRRRLLSDRSKSAGRQRALGNVPAYGQLRIGGPDRVLFVSDEAGG